jgi:hypothetical protein
MESITPVLIAIVLLPLSNNFFGILITSGFPGMLLNFPFAYGLVSQIREPFKNIWKPQ